MTCLQDGTTVVNILCEEYEVFIGRGSKWGNPFSHKRGTRAATVVKDRDEAIERYRRYILSRPDLLAQLHELKGRRLGCYCKPAECHGDVLMGLIFSRLSSPPLPPPVDPNQDPGDRPIEIKF